MWIICKKEWLQFFSSLTGYLAIVIFLLLTGLFLFVFPDSSLLNFGYASLNPFFDLAPWLLLFFIPTITMKSFADEFKSGTFEILKTMPITHGQLIGGKFLGAFFIIFTALFPTTIYAFTMQHLSSIGGMDVAATVGSYVGLLFLSAVFTAVGICTSSFTNNTIVAFIVGAFVCFLLYTGFDAISKLPVLNGRWDYYTEMLGINFHYKNISKGAIDSRDVIYFVGLIFLFLLLTQRNVLKK
jgi:ABC-2 type transport system permease protein